MRAFVFITLVHAVFCASISERAKDCGFTICTAIYAPVCGTDGITYSSICQLNAANCADPSVTLNHKGACGVHAGTAGRSAGCPMFCIEIWKPVCGSDGITYGNDCKLNIAHCLDNAVTKASEGSCGNELVAS